MSRMELNNTFGLTSMFEMQDQMTISNPFMGASFLPSARDEKVLEFNDGVSGEIDTEVSWQVSQGSGRELFADNDPNLAPKVFTVWMPFFYGEVLQCSFKRQKILLKSKEHLAFARVITVMDPIQPTKSK